MTVGLSSEGVDATYKIRDGLKGGIYFIAFGFASIAFGAAALLEGIYHKDTMYIIAGIVSVGVFILMVMKIAGGVNIIFDAFTKSYHEA